MKTKNILYFLFCLFLPALSLGQSVMVDCAGKPLAEVLIGLNSRYQVNISFDAGIAPGCEPKLKQTFASMDEAMNALAAQCGLDLVKVGGVYIFKAKQAASNAKGGKQTTGKETPKEAPPRFLFRGQVLDAESKEPLPFANIQIGGAGIAADENGRFSFKNNNASVKAAFRHLGYKVLEDSLSAGSEHRSILLQPSALQLKEVLIDGSIASPVYLATTGTEAGRIQANDIAERMIPGNGNNLMFQYLRMYPGVTAAGESGNYILWGSYEGQNQIVYDGFTLFNARGIASDIGRVNPLMLKNVEVYKGGYNAHIGDRAGGVMLIDSKAGDRRAVRGKLSLNNQTANAYLSIPLFKGSSALQLAGRKSYYGKFELAPGPRQGKHGKNFIIPIYGYGDLNLKFVSSFKNNDRLEISMLGSEDVYEEKLFKKTRGKDRERYFQQFGASSAQRGGSIKYFRDWKKGGISALTIAQSSYRPKSFTTYGFQDGSGLDTTKTLAWENSIAEFSAKIVHSFPAKKKQDVQLGMGFISDRYAVLSDAPGFELEKSGRHGRLSFFIKDNIQIGKRLIVQPGLKADLNLADQKTYWQPRLNGKYPFTEKLSLNFGWGVYRQFISKTAIIDENGLRSELWHTLNGKQLPFVNSMHHVAGLSYLSEKWEFNVEGFYKTAQNLLRFYATPEKVLPKRGAARAYGIDFFLKKRFARHEFWTSYSLGKAEERFFWVQDKGYTDAAQSQKHEIKSALVLDFSPFHFSATNVYGSGFPNFFENGQPSDETVPYWRVDAALRYDFDIKKSRWEAGVSVINLFNRQNVAFGQSVKSPDGSVINALAVPFTPTVYLNVGF